MFRTTATGNFSDNEEEVNGRKVLWVLYSPGRDPYAHVPFLVSFTRLLASGMGQRVTFLSSLLHSLPNK